MERSQNSSSSSSARWSSRDDSEHGMFLTVLGSPAPRATRPPRLRRHSVQPPNSPARPATLPVDRIAQLRSELNHRLEEGCDLSAREPSLSSSYPDLALDLSPVTDSHRGTDRSTTASSCDESEWSEGWSPHRPLLHATSYGKPVRVIEPPVQKPCERVARLSCSSSSRATSGRTVWSCDKCSRRTTSSTKSHSDLIEGYVETVNNAQLTRFFRPCVSCNQVCCQCPPSPLRLNLCTTCGRKSCACATRVSCVGCGLEICQCSSQNNCAMCREKTFVVKSSGRPPSGKTSAQCSSDEDRNSMVSRYLLERRFSPSSAASPARQLSEHNGDSGNSTLQLEDSGRDARNSILSRQHVSLSVMQLATAAQCARILADSLESVLELAKDELTGGEGAGCATAHPDAFNHESLLAAIKDFNTPEPRTGDADEENN